MTDAAADHIAIVGKSTAQQVADGLTNMIIEGVMSPGERISEAGIARSLGLSRNTVREAVRLLQGSGLVRYNFNRGMEVWDPTDDDVVDVFKARLYLERLAAQCLTPESELSPMRAAHRRYVEALETHDLRTIVERDLAIHQAAVAILGSARIDQFYAALLNELRYFLLVLSYDRHEYLDNEGVALEHHEMMEAFESRDPARAIQVVTAILEENRDLARATIARRKKTG
jgi:DNA-binding GntR family transcriptional regulator